MSTGRRRGSGPNLEREKLKKHEEEVVPSCTFQSLFNRIWEKNGWAKFGYNNFKYNYLTKMGHNMKFVLVGQYYCGVSE